MTAARKRATHGDAAQAELDSGTKHELIDGQLVAMAGGSPEHNQLAANALLRLGMALLGSPCRVTTSDQKVHVYDPLADDDAGLYPDVSVYCGPRQRSATVPSALTNPTLLVEVLSASTEATDRGRKFALYSALPSLQHYLLLSTDRVAAELYSRNDDSSWTLRRYGPGDRIPLPAIDAELLVDDLYNGVFDEADAGAGA
jgi:Uma2 family endonuclease